MEHKAYLHRSGRTARAGSSGDVVTVVLPEQRRDTDQLLRRANIAVRPQAVSAASGQVKALVGDVAPYVKPAPKAAPTHQPTRPKGGHPNNARRRGTSSPQVATGRGRGGQQRRRSTGGTAR